MYVVYMCIFVCIRRVFSFDRGFFFEYGIVGSVSVVFRRIF